VAKNPNDNAGALMALQQPMPSCTVAWRGAFSIFSATGKVCDPEIIECHHAQVVRVPDTFASNFADFQRTFLTMLP
jgi:hypothetical protein